MPELDIWRSPLIHLLAALALSAASSSPQAPQIPDDTEITRTESGLMYSVLKAVEGDGESPTPSDRVKVHYTGWLEDGTVFDSSRMKGTPAEFGVMEVITGWTEGLQLMKVGERFKFTIPSELGYGGQARPQIPSNSTLIFDVELLGITQGPELPQFRALPEEGSKRTASGLRYAVLVEGAGELCQAGDIFQLDYAFWTGGGTIVDCTALNGRMLAGSVDKMGLPLLKEVPLLMRPGTTMLLEVPASLAFGDRRAGALKPGATSVWRLEMKRVMKAPGFSLLAPEKLTTTDSGLQYEVIQAGEGDKPKAGQTVEVFYSGWLKDGTGFDAGVIEFAVGTGRVIRGWDEGLMLMQKGSIFRLMVPANLGYGAQDKGTIPPNSDLVFYVELLGIR